MSKTIFLPAWYFSVVYLLSQVKAQTDVLQQCNSTGMLLVFNKTQLDERGRNHTIQFKDQNDSHCLVDQRINTNYDQESISISAMYNECGIEAFETNETVVYNQTLVVTFLKLNDSDVEQYEYHVIDCVRNKSMTVNLDNGFVNVSVSEKTFSGAVHTSFSVRLLRTTSETYLVEDASVVTSLGDTMFFKIILDTTRNDLVLSPQDCYATNGVNLENKYYLIKDRCPNHADGTVKIHGAGISNDKVFLWENHSFRFHGVSPLIYLTCNIIVCTTSNNNAACKRCVSSRRRKRRNSLFSGGADSSIDAQMYQTATYSHHLVQTRLGMDFPV